MTLEAVPRDAARARIAGGEPLATRLGATRDRAPVGETTTVLLRVDGRAAYPVLDGIPILRAPEILTDPRERLEFDLDSGIYAEVYSESGFYEREASEKIREIDSVPLAASRSEAIRHLGRLRQLSESDRAGFPHPRERWLHARMDLGAEWDCYQHLAPVTGLRLLDLGGSGVASLILLLAGAATAELVTPMLGEARLASKLAEVLGVSDRFRCVVGIAEAVPLPDASVDAVFSRGSVHHMTTRLAFPEIARVLVAGGRFASIDPWRAPLYGLGTGIFGKRETAVSCRPLDRDRVAPLFASFSRARAVQHGTLTRYPMLAMEKLRVRFPLDLAWAVGRLDDRVSSLVPGLRGLGSGVALLATK